MTTDLERVKTILLGAEYEELLALKRRFENREELTEDIARIIAEALEARSMLDNRVSEVLAPTIDQAITSSIDQDPKKLAESLYPIMGPAIRKSITETLQQMLDNFNQLLEQSLSPQSLKWRFDAWRTGRSYSEMVLLNTLEYDVEQVFLIHLETSLLIRHAYSETAEQRDPDMVSSMFSAIQDFIQDSFSVSEDDVLDTLRLGELNVVLQRGPTAILAVVVRGSVPEQLRTRLKTTSEQIYRKKKQALKSYSGDPDDFQDLDIDLQEILAQRHNRDAEKREIPWLALVSILAGLAVATYFYYEASLKQEALQAKIDAFHTTPGVVVLSSEISDDTATVFALVDPLVRDPEALLGIDKATIQSAPYFSAENEILTQRTAERLKPAKTTRITVHDGVLLLSGTATRQWMREAITMAMSITGIESIDQSELKVVNPLLDELGAKTDAITSFRYVFDKEAFDISSDDPQIPQLASDLSRIGELRESEGLNSASFDVVGYTDDSGSTRLNRRIGLQRAQNLVNALRMHGITTDKIEAFNGFDYKNSPVIDGREVRIFIRD